MKLIASLAPARAEIEAGVLAKADQYFVTAECVSMFLFCKIDHHIHFLISYSQNFVSTQKDTS